MLKANINKQTLKKRQIMVKENKQKSIKDGKQELIQNNTNKNVADSEMNRNTANKMDNKIAIDHINQDLIEELVLGSGNKDGKNIDECKTINARDMDKVKNNIFDYCINDKDLKVKNSDEIKDHDTKHLIQISPTQTKCPIQRLMTPLQNYVPMASLLQTESQIVCKSKNYIPMASLLQTESQIVCKSKNYVPMASLLQPTINISTIGNVAHGKSSLIRALSSTVTGRFGEEKKKNMTIKLGYANVKIFKCKNYKCPRPSCYSSYSSLQMDEPVCKRHGCVDKNGLQYKCSLVRHISFIDSPGHHQLITTMFSGTSVTDGTLLLVAANETCPCEQTVEHFALAETMFKGRSLTCKNATLCRDAQVSSTNSNTGSQVSSTTAHLPGENINPNSSPQGFISAQLLSSEFPLIVVQNKLDICTPDQAKRNKEQIKEFLRGTDAEDAPIIPISAVHGIHMDYICQSLVENIPIPMRDLLSPAKMMIIRSFDVNKPGCPINKLEGGVIGGSLIQGVLRVGDEIEIRPGIITRNGEIIPIRSIIKGIQSEEQALESAIPGGLIAVSLNIDPVLTKSDRLVGHCAFFKSTSENKMHVFRQIRINYKLLKIGSGGTIRHPKRGENLLICLGSAKRTGSVVDNVLRINRDERVENKVNRIKDIEVDKIKDIKVDRIKDIKVDRIKGVKDIKIGGNKDMKAGKDKDVKVNNKKDGKNSIKNKIIKDVKLDNKDVKDVKLDNKDIKDAKDVGLDVKDVKDAKDNGDNKDDNVDKINATKIEKIKTLKEYILELELSIPVCGELKDKVAIFRHEVSKEENWKLIGCGFVEEYVPLKMSTIDVLFDNECDFEKSVNMDDGDSKVDGDKVDDKNNLTSTDITIDSKSDKLVNDDRDGKPDNSINDDKHINSSDTNDEDIVDEDIVDEDIVDDKKDYPPMYDKKLEWPTIIKTSDLEDDEFIKNTKINVDDDEKNNIEDNVNSFGNQFIYGKFLPGLGECVLAKINRLENKVGYYCTLTGYGHLQALLNITEARHKDIGKTLVFAVNRIDTEHKFVDITKKRMRKQDEQETIKKVQECKAIYNVLYRVHLYTKVPVRVLYNNIIWALGSFDDLGQESNNIFSKLKSISDAFSFSLVDRDQVFGNINIPDKVLNILMKSIGINFAPAKILITTNLQITCFGSGGVESVKKILVDLQSQSISQQVLFKDVKLQFNKSTSGLTMPMCDRDIKDDGDRKAVNNKLDTNSNEKMINDVKDNNGNNGKDKIDIKFISSPLYTVSFIGDNIEKANLKRNEFCSKLQKLLKSVGGQVKVCETREEIYRC